MIVSIDEQSPDIAQGVDTSEEVRAGTQRRGHPQQPGRRRPGDDVRLRLRRDRRPHAAADLAGPPPGRAAGRGAQGRRRSRTCAPTARPRSPSTTRTASRSRLKHRADLDPAPADGIDRDTLIQPDLIEHVIRPLVPGAVRRRRLRRATSTRPARSCSAARTPTPASPAARSSSTPTAAWPATAAARSRGKDPSKVDRSAAYAARWVAKHVVASGAADALRGPGGLRHRRGPAGVAPGRDVRHRDRSTRRRSSQAVREVFDLRPAAIIRDLDLRRPIYRKTAAYGHFGRAETEFTWEHTDQARRPQVARSACSVRRPAGLIVRVAPRRARPRQDVRLPGPARSTPRSRSSARMVRVPAARAPGRRLGRRASTCRRPPGHLQPIAKVTRLGPPADVVELPSGRRGGGRGGRVVPHGGLAHRRSCHGCRSRSWAPCRWAARSPISRPRR